jgi:hypothetical protein
VKSDEGNHFRRFPRRNLVLRFCLSQPDRSLDSLRDGGYSRDASPPQEGEFTES